MLKISQLITSVLTTSLWLFTSQTVAANAGPLDLKIAFTAEELSVLESETQDLAARSTKKIFRGGFDYVVCTKANDLVVRDGSSMQILFEAKRFTAVKLLQDFNTNEKIFKVDGRRLEFIRVQVDGLENAQYRGIGWVAKSLIKLRSECNGAPSKETDASQEPSSTPKPIATPNNKRKPRTSGDNNSISALEDPDCCNFPLKHRPTSSFESGMRRFSAGRAGGRLHAACDLYGYRNEGVESVAPGRVLTSLYYFYQGTYAVEVKHSGGFVVRYGEITGRRASGMRSGGRLDTGDTVGYMGKVNSGCCEPMLHFELYRGNRQGSLRGGSRFQRRSDLINPTAHLRKWQEKKFSSRD